MEWALFVMLCYPMLADPGLNQTYGYENGIYDNHDRAELKACEDTLRILKAEKR